MSLLLDALKRAETQKRRHTSADGLSGSMPDIDFSAIDPVALQRSGAKNLFNANIVYLALLNPKTKKRPQMMESSPG